jgi:cysteinyl-tRNA synthetase
MVLQEFVDLEESWNMTESILSRTDDVIQAMFGFITVLQCEDRITQMIDGIEKIMDDDIAYMSENGCNLIPADEDKLKERLISFYTIQDQRDYVQGIDNAMQGCKAKQADIEEFLLF